MKKKFLTSVSFVAAACAAATFPVLSSLPNAGNNPGAGISVVEWPAPAAVPGSGVFKHDLILGGDTSKPKNPTPDDLRLLMHYGG